MKRIALLRSDAPSNWVSCQSITRNLIAAYRKAFGHAEIREFALETGHSRHQTYEVAQALRDFSPDLIAFVDHAPHPGGLIRSLAALQPEGALPAIDFHVFGDFSLRPNEWLEIEGDLRRIRARFFCASDKQCRLLRSLITGGPSVISLVPFPVDASVFRFDAGRARERRKEFGVGDEDSVFFYAGRLSLQKNVKLLLDIFGAYLQQVDSRAQLWLAGRVDDIGVPFLGFAPPPGWFSGQLLGKLQAAIPEDLRSRVRFLGELGPEELAARYLAAGTYISLSTHNDEDFGMAPAEAALCGLPLVLTDWGGFSSFRVIGEKDCGLVPVRIQDRAIHPKAGDVMGEMVRSGMEGGGDDRRLRIARAARAAFSIEAVAERLASLSGEPRPGPIEGFSPLLVEMGRAFRANPQAPYLSGFAYSATYRRVYESYL